MMAGRRGSVSRAGYAATFVKLVSTLAQPLCRMGGQRPVRAGPSYRSEGNRALGSTRWGGNGSHPCCCKCVARCRLVCDLRSYFDGKCMYCRQSRCFIVILSVRVKLAPNHLRLPSVRTWICCMRHRCVFFVYVLLFFGRHCPCIHLDPSSDYASKYGLKHSIRRVMFGLVWPGGLPVHRALRKRARSGCEASVANDGIHCAGLCGHVKYIGGVGALPDESSHLICS